MAAKSIDPKNTHNFTQTYTCILSHVQAENWRLCNAVCKQDKQKIQRALKHTTVGVEYSLHQHKSLQLQSYEWQQILHKMLNKTNKLHCVKSALHFIVDV